MTTKHTPGPWPSARNHRWGQQVVARTDGGTVTVAHLGNADFDEENARLIAAAPDLLAACEAVLDSIEFCEAILPRDLRQQVGEAIAKARAR